MSEWYPMDAQTPEAMQAWMAANGGKPVRHDVPRPDVRRCCSCDSEFPYIAVSIDCVMCDSCWRARGAVALLCEAIARFVRRAEVAGLVEDVERSLEHSPACEYVMAGDVACDCYLGRASDALSRLARLAGGGA